MSGLRNRKDVTGRIVKRNSAPMKGSSCLHLLAGMGEKGVWEYGKAVLEAGGGGGGGGVGRV